MAYADRSRPHSSWPELACVFPGRSRRPRARLAPPVPELALVELDGGPVGDRHSRAGPPCRSSPVPGLARAAAPAPLFIAPTSTKAWSGGAPPTLVGIASPGLARLGGAWWSSPPALVELAAKPAGARVGRPPSPVGELHHTESTACHRRGAMAECLAGVDEALVEKGALFSVGKGL
jgi:hypothetical protein